MATVVIHHDMPLDRHIRGAREDLAVIKAETQDEALAELPDAEMFVTNPSSWDDVFLEGLESGNWVQGTGSGYTAFAIDTFEERGIRMTNAQGLWGATVAEHAMGLAVAFSRDFPRLFANQRRNTWDRSFSMELTDWKNRRLTVLGLGDLGDEVAKRGLAFDMNVVGVKRDPDDYDGVLSRDDVVASETFHDELPDTDLLVLTVPLNDSTRGIIGERELDLLPETAIVVNVARGPVVDEDALVDALQTGSIQGAGLDVFEEEPLPEDSFLWNLDNAILTPHVAGRSDRFPRRFADLFLENYEQWKNGEPLTNQIV